MKTILEIYSLTPSQVNFKLLMKEIWLKAKKCPPRE